MNLNRRHFLLGSAASAALVGCASTKIAPRTPLVFFSGL